MAGSDIEIILGNSNKRFSGVTSTMLQVLPHQQKLCKLAVLGNHNLPKDTPTLSFQEAIKLCKTNLPSNHPRVFHARRNDEMIQALLLKKIFSANIKIIFTSTAQRYHSKFTKWLIKQMDGIITTSERANSYLERKADIIIPHGVDIETYFPAKNKEQAWQALGFPGKFGIGIFGRVRHQKGVDLLVEAAIPILQENPDPTIVICGEITPSNKSFVDQLKTKIAAANLSERFLFLGKQPFEKIPKLMRAMHLVCALSRNEGFGLTIPEAMSSGTAVLASEAGAWKSIINDNSHGFCVPIDDLKATSRALKKLCESTDELIRMGEEGREHVLKHYTVNKEAERLYSYYSEIAH